jgi:type I restriction enzyme S subunit
VLKNIPNGWRVEKLGEVFYVKDGTHDSPKYLTDTNGYPLVTSKNIKNGKLDLTDCNYISQEDYLKINKRSQVYINDIIMPMIGTIGNPHLIIDEPIYAIKNVALFQPKKDMPKFLLHYLNSNIIKQKFLFDSNGGTQKFVSLTYLRKLPIPIPPLPQQEKIVKVLDISSSLIVKQKELLEKYDLFLKSKFIEMFGCPAKNIYDWKIINLEEVVKLDTPMVEPNKEEYQDMYHIGADRIQKHTGKLLPALTIKEENLISKKFLFNQDYVLYSKIRPNLNKVAIPNFTGLCSADIYPVKPINGKLEKLFLWRLLLSSFFLKYTETLPDRANIPKLNRKELAKFSFPLPPITLQNKFAQIVEKIETTKEKENKKLKHLEDLHNSLMNRAFKGEIE